MAIKESEKDIGTGKPAPKKTSPVKKAGAFGTKSAATEKPAYFPVTELADKSGLKPWITAALMRFSGWSEGKQVTEAEFKTALSGFNVRPMGGGRKA